MPILLPLLRSLAASYRRKSLLSKCTIYLYLGKCKISNSFVSVSCSRHGSERAKAQLPAEKNAQKEEYSRIAAGWNPFRDFEFELK